MEKYNHGVPVFPKCLSRKQFRGSRDKTSVRFPLKLKWCRQRARGQKRQHIVAKFELDKKQARGRLSLKVTQSVADDPMMSG